MIYSYTAIFNHNKQASFGGEVDVEPLKDDGTEKNTEEIMKEVKKALLEKYQEFFTVWQDISSIEVVGNNNKLIFKWQKSSTFMPIQEK